MGYVMSKWQGDFLSVYAIAKIKDNVKDTDKGFPYIESGDLFYLDFFETELDGLGNLEKYNSIIKKNAEGFDVCRYVLYKAFYDKDCRSCFTKDGRFKQKKYKQMVNAMVDRTYVCDADWSIESIGYIVATDENLKTTEIEIDVIHDPLPRKNRLGLKSLELDLGFIKCQVYNEKREDEAIGEYITETESKFILKIDKFEDGRNYEPERLANECRRYNASFYTDRDRFPEYGLISLIKVKNKKNEMTLYKKPRSQWAITEID